LAVRGADVRTDHRIFPGDRTAIRAATVAHSFTMIRAALA
jgi:nicotinamide-nucleotide amidase